MSPRSLTARIAAPAVAILLAVAVTASAGGRHYTVRPGDTLSAIAARYHTSVAALVHLNNLPGSGNLSYEEAGFNERMVSRAGAVGAMQIMPGTGQWISTYVVHRSLNIYRAQDNVTAGVALLSVLLRETGGNMRVAAAGYYQGLASVR